MPEEIDHIAELEKRLYARDPENVPKRTFGILRPVRQNVTSAWGETEIPKEAPVHKSTAKGYRRFFIFSFVFFLLALGGAAFSIYRGTLTLSSKNVDVSILGSSFTGAGETLPIQVEIANSNSASLLSASLSIDYPRGSSDAAGSDTVHVEQPIGTIGAGQTKSQNFSIILYGQQGEAQTITATFSYSLKNSSAVFQKVKTFPVTISSSPLTLAVSGPTSLAANQPFELTIHNTFNGENPLSNVIARVEYPNGFVFASATPAPTGGNNVWALGDLENGADKTIIVKGKLVGQQDEQKSFRVYVGTPVSATDNTIGTIYNSALNTVTLAEPFISAQMTVNGQSSDIAAIPVGDAIQGAINWVNNSALAISNPTFSVLLEGASIDGSTVASDKGSYSAEDNVIAWTGTSDTDIATIQPGQHGQLTFSFSPKSGSTADALLHLSVQGTFPGNNYAQQSISDIDVKTIRFSAHLQFASQAFYSVGPIKNTGPFPPKAGQPTTYTATWTARPSENSITNVVASAVLPAGVEWAGVVSPQAEPVTYSPDTRTVTWNVGVLPRTTSVPQVKTVSFQLKTLPVKAQVGQAVPLLGETTVAGTDAAVSVPLTVTRPALTTSLDSDPVYSQGKERVVP